MLAALSFKVFELDRYFVPKELVLNAAALFLVAALFARAEFPRASITDGLLIVFLIWSSLSALFATNHWLAQRALAVSLSSAVIFWSARGIKSDKARKILLGSAALASIIAASTSLAQAYGFETEYFTLARAPGGTLGNRNFIAHVAAIALPIGVWCTVAAKRPISALFWSFGVAVLTATLVLSRSRAAYLAVASTIVICGILLLLSRIWPRLGALTAISIKLGETLIDSVAARIPHRA